MLKSIISVNHSSIQIIQITCCKPTSRKLYHRPKIRWQNWQNLQNHRGWANLCQTHPVNHFQSLCKLHISRSFTFDIRYFFANFLGNLIKIYSRKHFKNRLRPHFHLKKLINPIHHEFVILLFRQKAHGCHPSYQINELSKQLSRLFTRNSFIFQKNRFFLPEIKSNLFECHRQLLFILHPQFHSFFPLRSISAQQFLFLIINHFHFV